MIEKELAWSKFRELEEKKAAERKRMTINKGFPEELSLELSKMSSEKA